MFTSVIVLVAATISTLNVGAEVSSQPLKPQQFIVDIGNGGGGTTNFNPSCALTPRKAALCWGYWGG
jgi:hypothetical protein